MAALPEVRRRRARFAAEILVCALLALIAFAVDSAIFTADLHKPTTWLLDGDGVSFAAMHFKGTLDNGWYSQNRFLGAPYGADLHDFPAPDLFYLGAIRIVGWLTGDWVLTYNLVIIAGYPAAAAASFAVMRGYGVRLTAALSCGVLYALIPFHQVRLYGHAHLGIIYFGVPLAVVPALEILRGSEILLVERAREGVSKGLRRFLPLLHVRDRVSIGVLTISVLTGFWGYVYFTFFAVFAIAVAGLVEALRRRNWLPILRAGICAGVTAAFFVVQNAGVLGYLRANGRVAVGLRAASDSEIFALKLVQLVLPMSGHRVEALRELRRTYDTTAPLVNENGSAYLGAFGALGFFVLLVVVLRGPRQSALETKSEERCEPLLWPLSVVNLAAFLLGTTGGLGALVAYLGFPDIRSYNRISVFIGFYALFAIAILFDRALERARTRAAMIVGTATIALLTVIGVYDQTFDGTPDYDAFGREFDADRAFVRRVEEALPQGAQVFQLPYMSFPEGGPKVGLADYAHLTAYLHSKNLRWSYGAMRGRIADERYRELANTPLAKLADAVTIAGYSAIWVDPRGFEDGGKVLDAELRAQLGEPITVGPRGIAVWSLAGNQNRLRESLGASELDRLGRESRERGFLGFNDGFYLKESNATSYWYTALRSGKVFIVNPSDHVQRWVFDTHYRTASPVAPQASLWIEGDLMSERLDIGPQNHRIERTLDVPPGTHMLRLRTDAVAAPDGGADARKRFFILQEPRLRPVP